MQCPLSIPILPLLGRGCWQDILEPEMRMCSLSRYISSPNQFHIGRKRIRVPHQEPDWPSSICILHNNQLENEAGRTVGPLSLGAGLLLLPNWLYPKNLSSSQWFNHPYESLWYINGKAHGVQVSGNRFHTSISAATSSGTVFGSLQLGPLGPTWAYLRSADCWYYVLLGPLGNCAALRLGSVPTAAFGREDSRGSAGEVCFSQCLTASTWKQPWCERDAKPEGKRVWR